MAKTKISEYSVTAGNNTDIDSINIDEGCAPSTINNAIRELMSHLKNWQSGVSGDTLPVASGGTGSTTGSTALIALDERTGATGSFKAPAGSSAQRDGSPNTGFFRFNTDLSKFEGYTGSLWGSVGGGATGGGNDAIFVENDQTVTTDYTIGTNKNAMSTGPISVSGGITVTVPSGSRWVVL